VGDGRPGPITRRLIDRVNAAMESPDYGLPIAAGPEQVERYLLSPGLLSMVQPEELPA
jgi:hypothetical protein